MAESPSKSESSSATGWGTGEGVRQVPPGRLFKVLLMRETHFLAGPLSSVPKTLPAFKGTISWKLFEKSKIRGFFEISRKERESVKYPRT